MWVDLFNFITDAMIGIILFAIAAWFFFTCAVVRTATGYRVYISHVLISVAIAGIGCAAILGKLVPPATF
jgi:hypothetical protein